MHVWEQLHFRNNTDLFRFKVPGGWLVTTQEHSLLFISDPNYDWLPE